MNPENLLQLTNQAENQYAGRMDGEPRGAGPVEALTPEEEAEMAARAAQKRYMEALRAEQLRALNVNTVAQPELRRIGGEVNQLLDQVRAGQPLNREQYEALQRRIAAIEPPDDIGLGDDLLHFNAQKSAVNAALLRANPIEASRDVKGKINEILIFSKDPRKEIEDFMNDFNTNDNNPQTGYSAVIDEIAKQALDPEVQLSVPDSRRKELRGIAEYAMEYATERIIGSADARPMDPFPQPNLYQAANLDSIADIARRFDEKIERTYKQAGKEFDLNRGIFVYLTKLRTARQATHEIFRLYRGGNKDQFKNGVTSYMGSEQLDFVENQIAGVAKAERMYEKYYGRQIAKHKGWSSAEEFGIADAAVAKNMEEGKTYGYDREGNRYELRPWQKKRGAAEGMKMTTLGERRVSYAITPEVGRETNLASWLKSIEGEYVARTKAPLKMLPERFMTWPGAKNFLGKIKRNMRSVQGRVYGIKIGDNELGIYGQSADALALLDTGNYELKSSGWRGAELLLGLEELRTETFDGKPVTIGEYLKQQAIRANEAAEHQGHEKNLSHEGIKDLAKAIYNDSIKTAIASQRFSLGFIMRNAGITIALDNKNKETIWRNVAVNIPSRIAAFFPGHTEALILRQQGRISGDEYNKIIQKAEQEGKQPRDILYEMTHGDHATLTRQHLEQAQEEWDRISGKLFDLEEARVDNDYTALRTDISLEQKHGARLQNLDISSLSPAEQALVLDLQSLGIRYAPYLAKMTFPMTAFMDDVPRTAWSHFTGPDLIRAFSDNESIEAGTGKITHLIQAPAERPDHVIKAFEEAYAGYSAPMGPEAQDKMAVFLQAYLELTKMKGTAKYASSLMRLLRTPRSELEEENPSAAVAWDEEALASILKAAAQGEIISDDPEKGGRFGTMYLRLRKELGADAVGVLLMYVRLIMMLLGPLAAIQFLKMILPSEFQKVLG